MACQQSAHSLYRWLLRAYPAQFRNEYGAQMEEIFAGRLRNQSTLFVCCEALLDVAISAPKEHLDILQKDLAHALRLFRKTPGFSLAALLALTVGIGSVTTVFTLFNAVLLRSLPYNDPERLVYLWTPITSIKQLPLEISPSWADALDWRHLSKSFTSITALQGHTAVVEGVPSQVNGARVLGNFFDTLGVVPELGRGFTSSDESPGKSPVAVISHALWQSRFHGDPEILNKSVRIDGRPGHIVGVMGREFAFPHGTDLPLSAPATRTDLWIPATLNRQQQSDRTSLTDTPDAVIARLRPNVGLRQAQGELASIEARLAPLYVAEWRSVTALVSPFLQTALDPVRPELNLMSAAVALVLLLACSNFANLLLARGSERVHEMGIRTAMGAERARLVRQILTESLLFSVVGGVLATAVSYAAVHLVTALNPGDIPRLEEASVDLHVLLFALAVSLLTGLASGLYPAIAASTVPVNAVLRQGGRGIAGFPSRIRNSLIVCEVAVAVVLLACGGLLLRSYRIVATQDNGFAANTLTMNFVAHGQPDPPSVALPEIRQLENRLIALHSALEARLRTLPYVEAAGWVDDLPLSHSEDIDLFEIEGQSAASSTHSANIRHVSHGYFEAMRIRLYAGRLFRATDIPADPEAIPATVVVSRSFARLHFPGRSAIGHRLSFGKHHWSTVIGVVDDIRHSNLEQTPQPTIYQPSFLGGTLVVKTSVPLRNFVAAIKAQASSVNPGSAITDVRTMANYVTDATARRRFQTVLLTVFSALAVLLALVGLYALLSYSVRQRTAEIGVRMALGASRRDVLSLVMFQGAKLTAAGLAVGLVIALWATRALSGLLYGVSPTDPVTFLAVPCLLQTVAAVASLAPAWKASRIDPSSALRSA